MKVVFERIQSASKTYFGVLFQFYLESFPTEERRELKALVNLLSEPEMFFTAVLNDNKIVGMVVYWNFGGFLYIEHLALFPDQRRKGLGSVVLKMLRMLGRPILLECEMPYDEISTNRVSFYNKAGFSSLPIDYFQPPYREGESLLPMMLFSDQSVWNQEVLGNAIKLFHWEVYRFGSELK